MRVMYKFRFIWFNVADSDRFVDGDDWSASQSVRLRQEGLGDGWLSTNSRASTCYAS